MATDNIFNGSDIGLYISTSSGGTYTLIAFSQDGSLSLSMETRDITNKSSSGWRELLESTRSGSISGNFFYAERDSSSAAVYGYDDLFGYLSNRTQIFVKFATNVTGDKYYTAAGYITSLEASAPTEDNTTCSVTIELTGAITEGTNS
jgi:TP901-1 family phage major tail protein